MDCPQSNRLIDVSAKQGLGVGISRKRQGEAMIRQPYDMHTVHRGYNGTNVITTRHYPLGPARLLSPPSQIGVGRMYLTKEHVLW